MMSFITKLFSTKGSFTKQSVVESDSSLNVEIETNERKSLHFGTDQVRVLLFRECEWRGRKLLFDSLVEENKSEPKHAFCSFFKNEKEKKCKTSVEKVNIVSEPQVNSACEDVNLLSEMVFGTVAMTYRGASFKIHAINSPPCLMSTKVFPASEHSACRKSEKQSEDRLGQNSSAESSSSNGSVRTQDSRPGSGNLSGNSLSPEVRKSSTCSSTGSGWDIEIPCSPGSSHSLENVNFSGKSSSLTSLRRRWIRALSTSLNPSESDYFFAHCSENSNEQEKNVRRHKTRLGLALLIRLTRGHEREMEEKLLEHAAFLEGMLNRLRLSCTDSSKGQKIDNGKGLVARLQGASSCCTIWLLRFLRESVNSTAPLLWHDTMLNTTFPKEERINIIHNGLKEMCRLLDNFDTKSTNFFLSTLVTAILTHHLGWVHTVSSGFNREKVEELRKQYPCNPLWAQLGDLYGALGSPVKVVHTVIAGDSDKVDTINSILTFLTYFIRSGIVKKEYERRCSSQQDVREAIVLLEQIKKKRPSSLKPSIPNNSRVQATRKTSKWRVELVKSDFDEVDSFQNNQPKFSEPVTSKLKRSNTLLKNLDSLTGIPPKLDCALHLNEEKDNSSNKVKIIVSETSPQTIRKDTNIYRETVLQELEKKVNDEVDDAFMEAKLDFLTWNRLSEIRKLSFEELEDSCSLPVNFDVVNQREESQVLFTLGEEEKSLKSKLRPRCNCQCAFTFTKVPSTSADLPEGVLRKIIQRNFPESSKNMQLPPESASNGSLSCLKCRRRNEASTQSYENNTLHLETPTNATDVLRSCGNSGGNEGMSASPVNSLEALMEANNVIELPMPRSNKIPIGRTISSENVGFTNSLMNRKITVNDRKKSFPEIRAPGYTWGLVMQGLVKKKKSRKKCKDEKDESDDQEKEWWHPMREEIEINARFPSVDQPVDEALCILADLDTWQVGLLSNNSPFHNPPLPIGMSRLVASMLEGFSYIWKKYHSPEDCIQLLESRLREMWLRSETLTEMLMTVNPYDVNVNNLTSSLDMDAADLPLLLAVATTHSPQIAQKFGLTLA